MSKPTLTPMEVVKCPCGHPYCHTYWIPDLGSFDQGTGFDRKTAQLLSTVYLMRDVIVAASTMTDCDSEKIRHMAQYVLDLMGGAQ